MFYTYVLKSISYGTRYVGSAEDVNKRLIEHNAGKVRYTKGRRPWKLIYKESYKSRSEAMKREKFLKSGQGRNFLDTQLLDL
ncbi:MAG TPA: GIY-YIG nuclease family protein [Patescibacteria group bacterium]|nr:GIY-YIG nuclease family protein [Patescibacteria group bacterium]